MQFPEGRLLSGNPVMTFQPEEAKKQMIPEQINRRQIMDGDRKTVMAKIRGQVNPRFEKHFHFLCADSNRVGELYYVCLMLCRQTAVNVSLHG